MIPLSSFVTLISGGNVVCTDNFVEGVDYYVYGLSALINNDSSKWHDVIGVETPTVSALDYFSANSDDIPSLIKVVLGPNQPYLTGGDRFFYKLATETGVVSGYGFSGEEFVIYPPTFFCNVSNSFFNGSGNLTIASDKLSILYINNCALSGIYITENTILSSFSQLFVGSTYLIASDGRLETFLEHIAQYGPDNGNIYVLDDSGYNNSPPTGMNPFKALNAQGQAAMETLTGIKGWNLSQPS